jgi:hypothetical protein
VDLSVFVQDAVSGEPVPQARITVRLTPRHPGSESIFQIATTAAATNKLFQAAVFDLPEPGWWGGTVFIEGLREPLEVHFEMEASEPLPRLGEMAPWIAWPAGVILLFCAHQWLMRRKVR